MYGSLTALERAYMILYKSLPKFQRIFVLNLVADAFEKIGIRVLDYLSN